MRTAEDYIRHLHLMPHPEGGFYKETYRSSETVGAAGLPERFGGDRHFSTAIYFLLRSGECSRLHRIKSDELWHYHAGSALSIYVFGGEGLTVRVLGPAVEKGEALQVAIPANTWFGATVNDGNSFTLSSCTVSPGFDFRDFELGERHALLKTFPAHRNIVDMLTL